MSVARILTGAFLALAVTSAARAEVSYAPPKGYTIERQQKDVNACRSAAIDLTGFDPAYDLPPEPDAHRGRETLKGAAIGAGAGAILGQALGGKPGAGALAGGAAGALGGRIKKGRSDARENAAYQHELEVYEARQAKYEDVFGQCLTEKGFAPVVSPVSAY